mmetsp:Transcript_6697/g.16488  ORF Transcript_6697/g.16488 Transcript_6697/m.16488 type:complete len:318 (+) Transcript_6697:439-1392(+)
MDCHPLRNDKPLPSHHILLPQPRAFQLDTLRYGRAVLYQTLDESIDGRKEPPAFQCRRFFLVHVLNANLDGFVGVIAYKIETERGMHHGMHLQIGGYHKYIFHPLHRRSGRGSRQGRGRYRGDGHVHVVHLVRRPILGLTAPVMVQMRLVAGEYRQRVHPILEAAVDPIVVPIELALYFEPRRLDQNFRGMVHGDNIFGGVGSMEDAGGQRKVRIVDAGIAEPTAVPRSLLLPGFAEVCHQRTDVALREMFRERNDAGTILLFRCRRRLVFLLLLFLANDNFIRIVLPLLEIGRIPIPHGLAFGDLLWRRSRYELVR